MEAARRGGEQSRRLQPNGRSASQRSSRPAVAQVLDGNRRARRESVPRGKVDSGTEQELNSWSPPVLRRIWPPNGSRLSCGRNARRRKEPEPQTKRQASEATKFLPTFERPPASSAC